jgi:chorismate mutase
MLPEIPELRASIDQIDRQIVELIAERLRLVMQVGEVKRRRGLNAYDPERERDLLERVGRFAPKPLEAAMAQRIFECIIEESRNLERRHMNTLPETDEPSDR